MFFRQRRRQRQPECHLAWRFLGGRRQWTGLSITTANWDHVNMLSRLSPREVAAETSTAGTDSPVVISSGCGQLDHSCQGSVHGNWCMDEVDVRLLETATLDYGNMLVTLCMPIKADKVIGLLRASGGGGGRGASVWIIWKPEYAGPPHLFSLPHRSHTIAEEGPTLIFSVIQLLTSWGCQCQIFVRDFCVSTCACIGSHWCVFSRCNFWRPEFHKVV